MLAQLLYNCIKLIHYQNTEVFMSKEALIQILESLPYVTKFAPLELKETEIKPIVDRYLNNPSFIGKEFIFKESKHQHLQRIIIHALTHTETLRNNPATFLLLQKIVTEKRFSDVVRNDALLALTTYFSEQSMTLIQQIATDNTQDIELRYLAILKFPEILHWLQQIIIDETLYYKARAEAIQILEKNGYFEKYPETISYLKQVITNRQLPKDWDIFELVMASLANISRHNSESRSFLRQLINDKQEDLYVRRVAMRSLAINLREDTEILTLLLEFLKDQQIPYIARIHLISQLNSYYKYFHKYPEILTSIWQIIADKQPATFHEHELHHDCCCVIENLAQDFREYSETKIGLQQIILKQLSFTKIELEKFESEFMEKLKEKNISHSNHYLPICYHAIWKLAEFYNDSDTFSLLQQIIVNDQILISMRCNAVSALIRYFTQNIKTFPLLKQVVINEQIPNQVRVHAVLGLLQRIKEHPEILAISQQIIINELLNEQNSNHKNIIESLGELAKEHLNVLPLLQRIAENKKISDEIRGQALLASSATYQLRQPKETIELVWKIASDKLESKIARHFALKALAGNFRWHSATFSLLKQLIMNKQESEEFRCKILEIFINNFSIDLHSETPVLLQQLLDDNQEVKSIRKMARTYLFKKD